MNRLKQIYKETIVPELKEHFQLNICAVPAISKIVLNMGRGEAFRNKTAFARSLEDLTLISGQKPLVTKAKKGIANFKIRVGYPCGAKVTLRSDYMYEFLDRLINIALPRTRDFRGLSLQSFDKEGNYHLGIREHTDFPEIHPDAPRQGLDISIITTTSDRKQAEMLLRKLGLPLRTN